MKVQHQKFSINQGRAMQQLGLSNFAQRDLSSVSAIANGQNAEKGGRLLDSSVDDARTHEQHDEEDEAMEDLHSGSGADEEDESDGDDGSGYGEDDEEPPYSIAEITGRILDFYKFLTTLHFDEADLCEPPLSGWPQMPDPDSDDPTTGKTSLVRSVLKDLSFFKSSAPSQIHRQSYVLDFSDYASQIDRIQQWDEYFHDANISSWDDPPTHPSDILVIAEGRESSGSTFVLVPKRGHIFRELGGGCGTTEAEDIMDFFDNLQAQYQKLELIGLPGRVVLEANLTTEVDRQPVEEHDQNYCPEADHHITLEELVDNMDQHTGFRTILNRQYVRQVLRKHGWPERFDCEAAVAEIKQLDEVFMVREMMSWEVCDRAISG